MARIAFYESSSFLGSFFFHEMIIMVQEDGAVCYFVGYYMGAFLESKKKKTLVILRSFKVDKVD